MNTRSCAALAEWCGHERTLTRPNQRWCGRSCRQKAYRERIKLLLKAALPARAAARREMAMARARERLERFRAHMERCRVNGYSVSYRESESVVSETIAILRT